MHKGRVDAVRNQLAKRELNFTVPLAYLDNAWSVEADRSYSVTRKREESEKLYVALRTLKGEGQLTLFSGEMFDVKPESLLLLNLGDIESYCAVQDGWQFYWYEFQMHNFELPHINELFIINTTEQEHADLERCFLNLGSANVGECIFANALFNLRLADWMVRASIVDQNRMEQKNIVALLENGRVEKLTVSEMARRAGMSERSFRDAAYSTTGLSPKAFILKTEMNAAMELLKTSTMSISEIATGLNFSSQFYFSRVFKKYFGIPPQQVRNDLKQ